MTKLLVNIFLILALLFGTPPISGELTSAIKAGDANKISAFFGESVDLNIPENEGVYSKTQAKLILKTFFLKNQPSDFSVVHNGDSKNNSHYSIGNLKTNKGMYRVYILYKEQSGTTTVLELRIESDE
ncbi:MAG: DUF4783 domain-containing protein [Flavobacteriales bacterium]|nr:DUF4783 domain-containing protein [Flavobacteriales bacterium]